MGGKSPRRQSAPGFSLPELLVVLAVLGIIAAVAVPAGLEAVDAWRTRGAAFFMASRVALTRMQAVHRQSNVALRFLREETGHAMRAYLDGNGNGVRSADIAAGVDPPLAAADRFDHLYPGARFGFVEGATLIDGSAVGADADPIRLGVSDMLTFSPLGTSTPGTVYIRGRGRAQYAVVVLGATGRSRIVRFDWRTRQWGPVE